MLMQFLQSLAKKGLEMESLAYNLWQLSSKPLPYVLEANDFQQKYIIKNVFKW